MSDTKKELIEINTQQIEFYNTAPSKRKYNFAMKLWRNARKPMAYIVNNAGIWKSINELQYSKFGDLSDKKTLDLGCFSGNALSLKIAEESKEYLGIDLSATAISQLNENIKKRKLRNARALAVDVLSEDFIEKDFDIVYAQGVLHHFKYLEVLLKALTDKMKPGGLIVTCDPLQEAPSSKIIRALYRPFQSNKNWEWPFNRKTFDTIKKYFDIVEIQGFLGYSKWAIPVALISKYHALSLAKKLHDIDMYKANTMGKDLWRCLQVVTVLKSRKK